MAKYDVFISYSRKDSQLVQELIDRLIFEAPQLKIWYDIDGIESAADFQTKIINAINESKAVIFACSKNSLESEYCRKEIMYAKHKGKNVIPYLLPGAELDGWLLFEFGTINCVTSTKPDEVNRMINDLKKWSNSEESGESSKGKSFDGKESEKLNLSSQSPHSNSSDSKTNFILNTLEFDPLTGEFKKKDGSAVSLNTLASIVEANGHEYEDLGLPSGTKWATRNLGAILVDEVGDFFAWGEIKPKSTYSAENSLTYKKDFKELHNEGIVTNNGNLTPEYDAARQLWGGSWRMPTKEEIQELVKYTTWRWTTIAEVKGTLVTSKINSKNIFLPAAGWMNYDQKEYVGEYGDYWSASLDKDSSQFAHYLYNNHLGLGTYQNSRFLGFPIRPVLK